MSLAVIVGDLVGQLAAAILRFATRGGTPLLAGFVAGATGFVLAAFDNRAVQADFYALCAQIFPVFLVALVVERRVTDRLGMTENQWVDLSWQAWREYVEPPSLPPEEFARWEADWVDRYPDHSWVLRTKRNKMAATARGLYRRNLAIQSATILFAITALVLGQVASLLGLLADGTGADSALYWITTSTFAGSLSVIVASAAGELFKGVVRGA